MNMSHELPMHLEKVYELVYQQVKLELGKQTPLSENESVANIQQENCDLRRQLTDLKSQHHQDHDHYHRQLSAREKQLVKLQSRFDELEQNSQSQRAQIKVLEQEKHNAQEKLAHSDINSNHQGEHETQQVELLKLELEEANIHCRVLKHHYSQLVEKNEELKTIFEHTETKSKKLEDNYQQKAEEFHSLQREFEQIEQQNRQHESEIARQKNDLMRVMDNYYDGVINTDKKVSNNVPRTN